jgi:hypothetical protein
MKKILLVSLALIVSLVLTGSAFANATFCASGCTYSNSMMGGGSYSPSTNVTLKVYSTTTAYCAGTVHKSSTVNNQGKEYATKSTDSTLRERVVVGDTGVPLGCTSPTVAVF